MYMTKDQITKLLMDDIATFNQDIQDARTEKFSNFSEGRLKEAEWLLSCLESAPVVVSPTHNQTIDND